MRSKLNRRISQLYDFELSDYFRKRLSVETEIRRFARGSILGSIRGSRWGSILGVHIGGPGFVGTRKYLTLHVVSFFKCAIGGSKTSKDILREDCSLRISLTKLKYLLAFHFERHD